MKKAATSLDFVQQQRTRTSLVPIRQRRTGRPNLDRVDDLVRSILGVEWAARPEFVVGAAVHPAAVTDDVLGRRHVRDDRRRERSWNALTMASRLCRATTADFTCRTRFVGGTLQDGTTYLPGAQRPGVSRGLPDGWHVASRTPIARSTTKRASTLNFIKRLSNRWMLRGYVQRRRGGPGTWVQGFTRPPTTRPSVSSANGGYDNDGELFVEQAAGSGAKAGCLPPELGLAGQHQRHVPGGSRQARGASTSRRNLFARQGTPLPYFFNRVTRSLTGCSVSTSD